jgi:L-threonylcarbamoyladenylate synthase
MGAEDVTAAVGAIRAGKAVILPADGVYGLCASAFREGPVRHLYELKGRGGAQPTAMMASSVEMLLECVPEFRGRSSVIVRALLPGPYTLVLANPARRYSWLAGASPETIGVRVAHLPREAQYVLDAVGAIAATSANNPGGPSAATLEEIPGDIRVGCAAELDAGPLSGEASTVIDFTGEEPRVLREGAGPVAEALERARDALSSARVASGPAQR